MFRSMITPLLLCALSLGCAHEPPLTNKLVDYNRAFAHSSNAILILNVLRAKDRQPLYFSTLSQLNPSITTNASVGLSIPLSPIAYTTLGINPNVSVSSGNTGTVATEHTQDFTKALLTPVSVQTFEYFWSQGWPREMLLMMMIGRIDIIDSDKNGVPTNGSSAKILINSPVRRKRFDEFVEFIRVFEEHVRFAKASTFKQIGPSVPGYSVEHLKVLVDASKSGLSIEHDKKRNLFRIGKSSSSVQLCFPDLSKEADAPRRKRSAYFPCNKVSGAKESENIGEFRTVAPVQTLRNMLARGVGFKNHKSENVAKLMSYFSNCRKNCVIVLHLRSPEAMIYYLGEISRVQISSGFKYMIKAFENNSDRLFDVRPGIGNPRMTVRHLGKFYHVPDDRGNRAMHAISLISQLLGLQRKASDLPRTTTVNVVRP